MAWWHIHVRRRRGFIYTRGHHNWSVRCNCIKQHQHASDTPERCREELTWFRGPGILVLRRTDLISLRASCTSTRGGRVPRVALDDLTDCQRCTFYGVRETETPKRKLDNVGDKICLEKGRTSWIRQPVLVNRGKVLAVFDDYYVARPHIRQVPGGRLRGFQRKTDAKTA